VNDLLTFWDVKINEISGTYFHRSNQLRNERVRQKIGLRSGKTRYSLYDCGNTSSASIPVTIAAKPINAKSVLLCGFGVGLSWGSAVADFSQTSILPLAKI
jgi:3-oxoacyl-[acyl-carrier-protein] synthase-3